MRQLKPPSLIIHLHCTAEEELKRIRRRARPVEDSIKLEYLEQINHAVDFHVMSVWQGVEVLSIDSTHQNFADDPDVQRDVVNLVFDDIKQ